MQEIKCIRGVVSGTELGPVCARVCVCVWVCVRACVRVCVCVCDNKPKGQPINDDGESLFLMISQGIFLVLVVRRHENISEETDCIQTDYLFYRK